MKYRCKADVRKDVACIDVILWNIYEMDEVLYEWRQVSIRELSVVMTVLAVTTLGRRCK